MANPLNLRAPAIPSTGPGPAIPGTGPDPLAAEQDAAAARARRDTLAARIAKTVIDNLNMPFNFKGTEYDTFSAKDLGDLRRMIERGVGYAILIHSDTCDKLNYSQQNRFGDLVAGTRNVDLKSDIYSGTGIHLTGLSEHFFKLRKINKMDAVRAFMPSFSLFGRSSAVPKERAAMYYFEHETFEQVEKTITQTVENALKIAASI